MQSLISTYDRLTAWLASRLPEGIALLVTRVALAGMKFFPWWTGPLNLLAWAKNRPYNALAADLWSPWDIVQTYCETFERWSTQWGMGYIARARLRADRLAE